MRRLLSSYYIILALLFLCSCKGNKENKVVTQQENEEAKKLMQGIWIDAEYDEPSFKVEGDTIFYPDTTSIPAHFAIMGDSLVINGTNTIKYLIIKQTKNLFVFRNNNGENIKLIKSNDNSIHVSIFDGTTKLYSRDFRKNDFAKHVPEDFLKQSILSDIILEKADANGVQYQVQLCMPNSPTNFIIKLTTSYQGNTKIETY